LKPALFLDRDGIIIHDHGYNKNPEEVRLIDNIQSLISFFRNQDFLVFIITNQSGIGRTWISLDDYYQVSKRMLGLLTFKPQAIDHIFFAPYFEASPIGSDLAKTNLEFYHSEWEVNQSGQWSTSWRKPNPGMLLEANNKYGPINFSNSVIIGDRVTDLLAGYNAGIRKGYLKINSPEPGQNHVIDLEEFNHFKNKHEGQFELVHSYNDIVCENN